MKQKVALANFNPVFLDEIPSFTEGDTLFVEDTIFVDENWVLASLDEKCESKNLKLCPRSFLGSLENPLKGVSAVAVKRAAEPIKPPPLPLLPPPPLPFQAIKTENAEGFHQKHFKSGWVRKKASCSFSQSADSGSGNIISSALQDRRWKKRFLVVNEEYLSYYRTHENFHSGESANSIPTTIISVKTDETDVTKFKVVTPEKIICFMTETAEDASNWLQAIRDAISFSISGGRRNSKSALAFKSLPGNDKCADCLTLNPGWISISCKVLICIDCAGIHRGLPDGLNKVKSICLDDLTNSMIRTIESWKGNDYVNRFVWMKNSEETNCHVTNENRENLIYSKYSAKRWADPQALPLDESMANLDIVEDQNTKYCNVEFNSFRIEDQLFVLNGKISEENEDSNKKRSISGSWKRRWCQLDQRSLSLYKLDSKRALLQTFATSCFVEILFPSGREFEDNCGNRFAIVHEDKDKTYKKLWFTAASKYAAEKWVSALKISIEAASWIHYFNSNKIFVNSYNGDGFCGYLSRHLSSHGESFDTEDECEMRFNWAFIRNRKVLFFNNEKDKIILGKLDLNVVKKMKKVDKSLSNCKHVFEVEILNPISKMKSIFRFCAESEKDLENWMIAIKGQRYFASTLNSLPISEKTGSVVLVDRIISWIENYCGLVCSDGNVIYSPEKFESFQRSYFDPVEAELVESIKRRLSFMESFTIQDFDILFLTNSNPGESKVSGLPIIILKQFFDQLPSFNIPIGPLQHVLTMQSGSSMLQMSKIEAVLKNVMSAVEYATFLLILKHLSRFISCVADFNSLATEPLLSESFVILYWARVFSLGVNENIEPIKDFILFYCLNIEASQLEKTNLTKLEGSGRDDSSNHELHAMAKLQAAFEAQNISLQINIDSIAEPFIVGSLSGLTTVKEVKHNLLNQISRTNSILASLYENYELFMSVDIFHEKIAEHFYHPNRTSNSQSFSIERPLLDEERILSIAPSNIIREFQNLPNSSAATKPAIKFTFKKSLWTSPNPKGNNQNKSSSNPENEVKGLLWKEGVGVRSWKHRYFSLKQGKLTYWKDVKSFQKGKKEMIGVIALDETNYGKRLFKWLWTINGTYPKSPCSQCFCLWSFNSAATKGVADADDAARVFCTDCVIERNMWMSSFYNNRALELLHQ